MGKKYFFPLLVCALALGFSSLSDAARKLNWEKINPNLKGATTVGDTLECLDCHEDYIKSFEKTKHSKVYKYRFNRDGGSACEVCHGPLSKHLAETDLDKKLSTVVSFKTLSFPKKNAICLQCHKSGSRMHWQGSTHQMANVTCDKCHYVMKKRGKHAFSIFEDSKKVCFQCHKDKRARMFRTSHMPLREGKMNCASCHNPHGGPGPSLLKKATVNETCYLCHQEKRGPFIWEHPPVRENCSNCHNAHGSNFNPLLKLKIPYLCQQCHVAAFHPSTVYDGRRLPRGSIGATDKFLGKGCLNCHSKVHGSNHPSGARLIR